MTPAEFKSTRESLHLTVKWLATHMRVRRQSVQRWENGRVPIPDSVQSALHDLEVFTKTTIDEGVAAGRDPLPVPRLDENDKQGMPPAWHRMVAKQVACQTGARIVYEDDDE